jgi:hypothetical protein|tara:strand:+ start:1387 stop:1554 length:168 start_codon:yes stop_codon:yes gene_type:complete
MARVKMMMTLSVDEEEYPIASDGMLTEDLEDYMKDLIHEVDGLKVTNIKTIIQET